jgi:amidase
MEEALAQSLTRYDATALAGAIAKRKLSSVEIVSAHLEVIDRLNGKYNAIVTLDREGALRRAREADEALARGETWGPLHGLPITVKDSIETEGLRTTAGFEKLSAYVPGKDAWIVSRMKRAGAIVLGKTNCARLCCDIQTSNQIFGQTNNPYDVERTSGGSSGGEAVAVALGMSPLGLGSDTGGSIRIPSSYCGVFGLKTSIGRISTQGLLPALETAEGRKDSLTAVGFIARSIRDLALCDRVLTGESWDDAPCPPRTRVFYSRALDGQPIDDDVAALLAAKISSLSGPNVEVVKVDPPDAALGAVWTYVRLSLFEFTPKENDRRLHCFFWCSEWIRSLFRGGVRASYAALKAEQEARRAGMARFMNGCDVWIVPATATAAFRHCKKSAMIPMTVEGRTQESSYFVTAQGHAFPFNLLGNPCVVLPLGHSKEGMPIAIQVVGKPGQDLQLLSIVSALAKNWGTQDLALSRNDATVRRLARVQRPRIEEAVTPE